MGAANDVEEYTNYTDAIRRICIGNIKAVPVINGS